ncbi:MgtC/SapB family protein [Sphingopyxis sp. BSN-002]|uniref:MgtC/SapB family protein n=1 Tax=Sphingopyxis sp. BSN-002 TaxID=2911495 RepID=UPI001EDAFCB0|nr:MgtC/SapB family protein [Sphingopyxis sp. BSN-002]UKK85545.1 MgtC/SapB family protein [Sphingopyxis sp. BSN-002]
MPASLLPLGGIALAFLLGLLVGVQRGWAQRDEAEGSRFAGVRTFALFGLAGGISGTLADAYPVVAATLASLAGVLALIGYAKAAHRPDQLSGTSSLAALITIGCGFLAASGRMEMATIVAAGMTMVLALRSELHGWVSGLTDVEVGAIARFALIALAILPLLPDSSFGPYEAWNPRQLWLVVVFVSGFSLLGYIAAKRFGATRGTLVMAGAGAMVSSTAVTAALAMRVRDGEESEAMAIAGIGAASAVMLVRAIILTTLLAPAAMPGFAWMAAPAAIVSSGAIFWGLREKHVPARDLPVALRNPFRLAPAIGLMLLVMLLTATARWMMALVGERGLALVIAISGLADVDSAIITVGSLPRNMLAGELATVVIIAPVLANTLFKGATAVAVAGWRKGWRLALPLVLSVAASLALVPVLLV